MYHLPPSPSAFKPSPHPRRRRSSSLVNTADYLHTPGTPAPAPATDGSTTDPTAASNSNNNGTNNTTTDPHPTITTYHALLSPVANLATLQTRALHLALKRGADDAFIKARLAGSANARDLVAWVEWESAKEAYEWLAAERERERNKKNQMRGGRKGRKVPPLMPAGSGEGHGKDGLDAEAPVRFVSVVGREFNRDPGLWAVQTMAENEVALAAGAKRVGTLLREQRVRDAMVLGSRGGVGGKEEVGKNGKDGKAGEQKERVVGILGSVRGEEKGEVKKVKGAVKGYGGLKRGDARLWQH